MRRAGAWWGCGLALLLGACRPATPAGFSGVVEVEPVLVAAPLAGRLVELAVQRGAQVAAGAPLFALEHASESDAVREAQAGVARAEAAARDLASVATSWPRCRRRSRRRRPRWRARSATSSARVNSRRRASSRAPS